MCLPWKRAFKLYRSCCLNSSGQNILSPARITNSTVRCGLTTYCIVNTVFLTFLFNSQASHPREDAWKYYDFIFLLKFAPEKLFRRAVGQEHTRNFKLKVHLCLLQSKPAYLHGKHKHKNTEMVLILASLASLFKSWTYENRSWS